MRSRRLRRRVALTALCSVFIVGTLVTASTALATDTPSGTGIWLLDLLFPPAVQAPPADPPPPPPPEAPPSTLVADAVVRSVPVFAGPAGGRVVSSVSGFNSVGQREAFVVIGQVPGWFQVQLPVKPNGSTGWVQASSVTTRTVPYYVRVKQSQFRIELYQNGRLQSTFPVAVGAPSTPTPNGTFFVWAAQGYNRAPYAVGIFALSGFSPVLDNWPGGGRTGIHGWRDAGVMGTRASHGCVRMTGGDFSRLINTVPLGTPVEILP